jgi:hypothetical protein
LENSLSDHDYPDSDSPFLTIPRNKEKEWPNTIQYTIQYVNTLNEQYIIPYLKFKEDIV